MLHNHTVRAGQCRHHRWVKEFLINHLWLPWVIILLVTHYHGRHFSLLLNLSDCLVITDDKEHESSCDVITLRLQGKEKGSTQEYSVDKVCDVPDLCSFLFWGRHVVHLSTVTCIFILSYGFFTLSTTQHASLGSLLSQYTSGLSAAAKRRVKFFFDGLKVTHNQTPSQLDMEDGDVIDVWAWFL